MNPFRELRTRLEVEVIAFDVESVPPSGRVGLVGDLAAIEKLAATAKVLTAVAVAQSDGWQGEGDKSPADWLARTCGISVHAAADQLGLGRKLRTRPKTKEAMRRGRVSPEQAKSVADAAEADPGCEDRLLDLAGRATLSNLKAEAQKARAAAEDDGTRQRRIHARRSLRTFLDGEGAFNLHLRGTAVDGARISQVLKPLGEHMFRHGRAAGVRDSFEARSYDAFLSLVNRYLAGTDVPVAAPSPRPTAGAGTGAAGTDAPAAAPSPRPTTGAGTGAAGTDAPAAAPSPSGQGRRSRRERRQGRSWCR